MFVPIERRLEVDPELKNLALLWVNRCKAHANNHIESWGVAYYQSWSEEGSNLIAGIHRERGTEVAKALFNGTEGLSLRTQIRLLLLGQTEELGYLLSALDTAYPEDMRVGRNFQFGYDHYLEEGPYREILATAIANKYPDEDTPALLGAISAARPKMKYANPDVEAMSAVEAMELALTHGPNFMLKAFTLIPPEEISLRNFERRLAIEQKIRETGEDPVEQELCFSGSIQVVGFREFCIQRAREWGIRSGFARNERDDKVTVLVQAHPSIIAGFLAEVQVDAGRRGAIIESMTLVRQGEIGERLNDFQSLDVPPLPKTEQHSYSPVVLFRRITGW